MREVTCPICQYGLTALVASASERIVCPECGLQSTARELLKARQLVLRVRRSDILAPAGLAAAIAVLSWTFLSAAASPGGVVAALLTPIVLISFMCALRMREYRSRAGYRSCFFRALTFRLVVVWAVCAVAAVAAFLALIIASNAHGP
ncbi:MAG: hypothetical protein ACREJD_12595 [Phycisphaerales bacterium]